MRFERFVGVRYLLATRRHGFLSLITVLSITGVALGVGFLIMVISVMAGFEEDLRDRIIGLDAHVVISSVDGIAQSERLLARLKEVPGISGMTPYVEGEALVSSGDQTRGALVRGIDPESAASVLRLPEFLQGSCKSLSLAQCLAAQGRHAPLLMGHELALDLKFFFDTHRNVQLISPLGRVGPMGFEPHVRSFQVTDTFRSGFYEYDSHLIFMSLDQAQRFFGSGDRVSGVDLAVKKVENVAALKKMLHRALDAEFPGLSIETWEDRNQSLFAALKLEKIVMFAVLLLIVLVASMVILVTLSMLVMEKRSEIGILRTLGVSRARIETLFMFDGLLIGGVGAGIGFVLGLGLCFLLKRYEFVHLPEQVYYVTTIPVVVRWPDMITIALCAMGLAVLAAMAPARQASQADPVEVLRRAL